MMVSCYKHQVYKGFTIGSRIAANMQGNSDRSKLPLRCGKETNAHLPDIEVDEPGSLVRYEATEIAPHETMPRPLVHLLYLALDGRSNFLLRREISYGIL